MKEGSLFIKLLLLLLVFCSVFGDHKCFCAPLSGSVEEEFYVQFDKVNTVVDNQTGNPVSGAVVSIPSKGIVANTDEKGRFNLNTSLKFPTILSVKAPGYKPFSLTITEDKGKEPFTIGISKETGKEIIIDHDLHHLGDNVFSKESANADDFKLNSSGPYFSKEFYIDNTAKNSLLVLRIGSVIGLDTAIARKLNQGTARNGISSPTVIYLNSKKVAELKINGDNQEIPVPAQIVNFDSNNQLVIETGQNLYAKSRVDHDDIEFINLILEIK